MIKKYVVNAEVVGIGKPIEKTSAKGNPYSYCQVHFLVDNKYTDGRSAISVYLYDYQDLFVGAKVNLEIIRCGKETAYYLV